MSAATFFFSGKGYGNDRQSSGLGREDRSLFHDARRSLGAIGGDGEVLPGAGLTNHLAHGRTSGARRRSARRSDPIVVEHAGDDLTILRSGDERGDRSAPPGMEHQQQVGVPEDQDVLRCGLDVMGVDVPHAQRGVKRANEERPDKGQNAHAVTSLRSSSANCRSYSLR